jgi:predicted amidohydrolase YtcJ
MIYTVNNSFDQSLWLLRWIGQFGTNDEIRNKFKSNTTINAKGKFIYPGLIDVHTVILRLWT